MNRGGFGQIDFGEFGFRQKLFGWRGENGLGNEVAGKLGLKIKGSGEEHFSCLIYRGL